MSIRVKCEECGAALKVKDELAGKKGNCPQCKAPLQIPSSVASESESNTPETTSEELSEEDAIFGKGFFDAAPPPARPRTLDLGSEQEDTLRAEAPDRKEKTTKKKATAGFTAAKPETTDNSANIAGSLLSKTGKKNRADAGVEEDADKVEYDFTEVKYLLKTRVLPCAAAIVVSVLLYLWLSAPESNLPPLAEVSGRVTVDGAPYPAQLLFSPSDTKTEGSGSIAQCNPDGTYEVFYNADAKGAVVGPNTIRIITGTGRFSETREVVAGTNEFNFDLQTQ